MRIFLVNVKWDDPYPKEMSLRKTAVSMGTAVRRALEEWKKEEGRGVENITIKVSRIK